MHDSEGYMAGPTQVDYQRSREFWLSRDMGEFAAACRRGGMSPRASVDDMDALPPVPLTDAQADAVVAHMLLHPQEYAEVDVYERTSTDFDEEHKNITAQVQCKGTPARAAGPLHALGSA